MTPINTDQFDLDAIKSSDAIFLREIQWLIETTEECLVSMARLVEHKAYLQIAINALIQRQKSKYVNGDSAGNMEYEDLIIDLGVLQGKVSEAILKQWANPDYQFRQDCN
ncbi:MAG: hypothetical protein INR69_15160 [Mucilaginibacter polytrichastri]|nr:hypothetical protein [Mucilaginibacter polytrichastri]